MNWKRWIVLVIVILVAIMVIITVCFQPKKHHTHAANNCQPQILPDANFTSHAHGFNLLPRDYVVINCQSPLVVGFKAFTIRKDISVKFKIIDASSDLLLWTSPVNALTAPYKDVLLQTDIVTLPATIRVEMVDSGSGIGLSTITLSLNCASLNTLPTKEYVAPIQEKRSLHDRTKILYPPERGASVVLLPTSQNEKQMDPSGGFPSLLLAFVEMDLDKQARITVHVPDLENPETLVILGQSDFLVTHEIMTINLQNNLKQFEENVFALRDASFPAFITMSVWDRNQPKDTAAAQSITQQCTIINGMLLPAPVE